MLKAVERSFPENFRELSLKSIEEISGENLKVESQFDEEHITDDFAENPEEGWLLTDFDKKIVKLTPSNEKTQIVGVDVSSRKIGISKNGLLCAFRGTIVWRDEYCYKYKRYGPFLFHIKNCAANNMETPHPMQQPFEVMSKIQVSIEREMQEHACQQFANSIILLDGCLAPQSVTPQMLRIARRNQNKILAIAKKSRIFEGRYPLYSLEGASCPCILHLGEPSRKTENLLRNSAWIFAAKLSKNGLSFRLDADGILSFEEAISTVQMLMGNDLLVQGYPETLRMAHTLSIFTSLEALALQRFLTENYHIKIQRIENMRRMLFGPFGKWVDS